MRSRLLRLTALTMGALALAGGLPRDGRFAAGFSWISAAHADDADVDGGNGEGAPGGSDQGGENIGSGGTEGGGDGGGGDWGSGDGSGAGEGPGGTGAGGGGGAIDGVGVFDGDSERHSSSSRDGRDYGPTGSAWHGGSSFLNLFRRTPEGPIEGNRPESSPGQKSDTGSSKSAGHTKREP
ncbi:hypothetical protein [Ensifer sp. SSB1]|uniref:hypothetical protein n=1 Tax=Ensifer sp. SSB1 TaxID=2795385 RepID=UPI0025C2B0D3|nr:hypothetical protein [Ensifer sp. SSB1]